MTKASTKSLAVISSAIRKPVEAIIGAKAEYLSSFVLRDYVPSVMLPEIRQDGVNQKVCALEFFKSKYPSGFDILDGRETKEGPASFRLSVIDSFVVIATWPGSMVSSLLILSLPPEESASGYSDVPYADVAAFSILDFLQKLSTPAGETACAKQVAALLSKLDLLSFQSEPQRKINPPTAFVTPWVQGSGKLEKVALLGEGIEGLVYSKPQSLGIMQHLFVMVVREKDSVIGYVTAEHVMTELLTRAANVIKSKPEDLGDPFLCIHELDGAHSNLGSSVRYRDVLEFSRAAAAVMLDRIFGEASKGAYIVVGDPGPKQLNKESEN